MSHNLSSYRTPSGPIPNNSNLPTTLPPAFIPMMVGTHNNDTFNNVKGLQTPFLPPFGGAVQGQPLASSFGAFMQSSSTAANYSTNLLVNNTTNQSMNPNPGPLPSISLPPLKLPQHFVSQVPSFNAFAAFGSNTGNNQLGSNTMLNSVESSIGGNGVMSNMNEGRRNLSSSRFGDDDSHRNKPYPNARDRGSPPPVKGGREKREGRTNKNKKQDKRGNSGRRNHRCDFWERRGGCRRGDECDFLHIDPKTGRDVRDL